MSQPIRIPGAARRSSLTLSRSPSTSEYPSQPGYQATPRSSSYGALGRDSGWDSELPPISPMSSESISPSSSMSDVQANHDDRRSTSLGTVHELARAARMPAGAAARNLRAAPSLESPSYQRFEEEAARERIPTLTNTSSSAAAARSSVLPPSFIEHSPAAVGPRASSTSQIPFSSPRPTPARAARAPSVEMPIFTPRAPSRMSSRRGSGTSADSSSARLHSQHVRSEEARAAAMQRETARIVDARRRRAEWMSDLDQESAAREQSRRSSKSRASSVPDAPNVADAVGRHPPVTRRRRGSDVSAASASGRRVSSEDRARSRVHSQQGPRSAPTVDRPTLRYSRSYSAIASPGRAETLSKSVPLAQSAGAAVRGARTRREGLHIERPNTAGIASDGQAAYTTNSSPGRHTSTLPKGDRRFSESFAADDRPPQADLRRQTSSSSARSGWAAGPSSEVVPILARAAELVQQEREAQERIEAEQRRILVEQWRAQQEEQLRTQAMDSKVNKSRSSAHEPVSSQPRSRSTSTSTPVRPRATPKNLRQAAPDANSSERGRDRAGWQRVWQHTAGIVAQKKLVEDEFQQKWLDIAKREAAAALNPSLNTENFQAERARVRADFDHRRASLWPVNYDHLQDSVAAEEGARELREEADLQRAVQFGLALHQARRRLQREQDRCAWTAYENAWAGLAHKAANARLRWTDIPWPMLVPPARAEGLVSASIADFILSPAHSNGRSQKDRLRYALVRWHPARFEGHWLPKCAEGQREEIKNGALLVVRVLRGLLPEPSRDSPLPQPPAAEQQQKPTATPVRSTAEDDRPAGGVSNRWTLPRDNCLERGSTVTMTSFRLDRTVPITVLSAGPIASGTSAYVYQGIIVEMGQRIVALKVFPSIMKDTERELLCRELINVSQMAIGPGCERILPFLGTAMHGGRMILVSEYMSHGNVLDFLAKSPAAPRQQLTLQVAEGVTFLHTAARLVHGDLKCENVLVNSSGTAVIADFGLSTTIDKLDHTTAAGIRHWNTLAFAAPELHLDEATNSPEQHRLRSKTPKSDVYAFGMLVLQAFTGKRPWLGSTGQAILRKVCNGDKPERPGHEIAELGLTDAWWSVCMKCWETSPLDRPSIDTVLAVLQATAVVDTH